MEKTVRLKSCPFCGGEAELIRKELPDRPLTFRYFVMCIDSTCEIKAETCLHREQEMAIDVWNKRRRKR